MKKTVFILFVLASVTLMAQKPHPYFSVEDMPDATRYLPTPPDSNEMRFAYDTAQYRWGKSLRATPRGEKARLDAEYSIRRMAVIFAGDGCRDLRDEHPATMETAYRCYQDG